MRVDPEEREKIVQDYVRERIRREAKKYGWGGQSHFARIAGVTPAHMTNVLKSNVNPGTDMIDALAKHWGLVGYAGIEAQALVEAGHHPLDLPPLRSDFPELSAALAFSTGFRPIDFLLAARHEAEAIGEDRPRREWLAWLDVKWGEWQRSHPPQPASKDRAAPPRKLEKPKGGTHGAT